MESGIDTRILAETLAEFERKFFWWENVVTEPRSESRIIAQAMSFAGFDDILRLERTFGPDYLVDVMLQAAPGWIDKRSWELWRGRLTHATGRTISTEAPVRSFDVGPV
jgi:hypothetical protein